MISKVLLLLPLLHNLNCRESYELEVLVSLLDSVHLSTNPDKENLVIQSFCGVFLQLHICFISILKPLDSE
jgi:hypothetical protein